MDREESQNIIWLIRNYIQISMGAFKVFKTMVHNADFFSTTQLIRYQEDPDFKTVTGGLFSIAIIAVLGTIFYSMAMSALRREDIEWSSEVTQEANPPKLEVPYKKFNIGIQLGGYNLSDTIQYFDIELTQKVFVNKTLISSPIIPTSACRRQDWNISSDILNGFDHMKGQNWLCAQVDTSFFVEGKWTSEHFSYIEINVLDCGTINTGVSCYNSTDLAAQLAKKVHFSIYYVNSLITAGTEPCVSYYMADQNFIYFGSQLGASHEIFISEYDILTDYSILPYTDYKRQNGGIVTTPNTVSTQEVGGGWYSRFRFRKATTKHYYKRAFIKFDTVISYIGGLFGAIIGLLFLMNHYTRTNFEIELARMLYVDDQDCQSEEPPKMNFCNYVGFWVYKMANIIGCNVKWPYFAKLNRYRTEVQKHLDIKLMLEKLSFLERSMLTSQGKDKYQAMHLKSQLTLNESKKMREYYYMRPMIISSMLKKKKQSKEKKQIMEKQMVESAMSSLPAFVFNKGKITPMDVDTPSVLVSPSNEVQYSNIEGRSQVSHQTVNFTRKTRMHITDKRSHLSQEEHWGDDIQLPQFFGNMKQLWKMALNGDEESLDLWNAMDADVRLILEKKLDKELDADFVVEKSVSNNNEEYKLQ